MHFQSLSKNDLRLSVGVHIGSIKRGYPRIISTNRKRKRQRLDLDILGQKIKNERKLDMLDPGFLIENPGRPVLVSVTHTSQDYSADFETRISETDWQYEG